MPTSARETSVGLNIATAASWGTSAAVATAVGAGDGHYVRDDMGLQLSVAQSLDDSAGQSFIGSVQAGFTGAVQGTIPMYLHYNDQFLNPLWALALGTGDTTPNQLGASTAYTGTFIPAVDKAQLWATLVQDKEQNIEEVPGVKITGFELRSGDMGRMELDFMFIGDDVTNDSTTNTATEIGNLTYPTLGLRAFLSQCVFRINAQGGAGLLAADAYAISSVRVRFEQPMDAIHVGGQNTIIEPAETDYPRCEIEVTFARNDGDGDDAFDWHRDTTALKCDLTWTGPAIGTLATQYSLAMQFPHVYAQSPSYAVPGGGGQITPTVTFTCLGTSAAPTGMPTEGTGPLHITTTGEATTNPFA